MGSVSIRRLALYAVSLAAAVAACSQSPSTSRPVTQDSGMTGNGGAITSGGASGQGGISAAGGGSGGSTSAGGAASVGGAMATGGRVETGGTPGTGGAVQTGGMVAAGGQAQGGGQTGSGGLPGSGGTTGADAAVTDAINRDAIGSDTGRDLLTADKPADTAPDGAADAATESPPADARPTDAGGGTCSLSGAATATTPTVYVIGDSTASIYTSDLYPRMGWAQPLQDFFAPACATIADKALSGRSSKSFYDEGDWTPIKNALRKGDYVLIQFGHNDEKTDDPARGTDPFTTFEQYLSIYLDDTIAKGATPILLTPINRNNWSGTTLQDTHGDYPVAMRQLAAARQVALIDATALTKTYFERIGQTATTALFMDLAAGQFPNYPSGNTDNTHLQEKGARTIAQMVLADLYRQGLAPGTLAKTVPTPP